MEDLTLMGAELLVWMESNLMIAAAVAICLLVPGLLCCLAARHGVSTSRGGMQRIEQRLTQISSAVELLTDTTESAMQTTFTAIERLSAENSAIAHRAGLPERLTRAARDGQTAREIAQSEGVSEGEVRLRLKLQSELGDTPVHPVVQ